MSLSLGGGFIRQRPGSVLDRFGTFYVLIQDWFFQLQITTKKAKFSHFQFSFVLYPIHTN